MANAAPVIFTGAQVFVGTSSSVFATSTAAPLAIDISTRVRSVRLSYTADEHDDTVMGLTSHSRVQGLFSWDVELECLQDFDSGGTPNSIDELFFDLLDNKVKFNVCVRPVAGVRSSDNPEYQGPVRVRSHDPVTGAVGDLLTTRIPLMSAGNLSRKTSGTSS